jgi:adenylate cyclase
LKRYIAPVALIIIVAVLFLLGIFERLELNVYDSWFKLRGQQQPGEEIVIVAIDEKSIEQIGPPSWPRTVHARLLDHLKEAKVVGFDLLFDIPGDPGVDTEFAGAVKRNGHVVLASTFKYESESGQWYQKLISPLKQFTSGSAGLGFINTPEDMDGVVRNVTLIDTNTFKRPYPCLSLAVALASAGLNPNALSLAGPDALQAGSLLLPLNSSNNQMLLSFWGGANTFKTISYIDVLSGNIPPGEFRDKIVLVGDTSPLVKDDFRTPFSASNLVLSGRLPTPGVEVHANAVKTILDSVPYRRAGTPYNLAILVFSGTAAVIIVGRRGPWVGLGFVLLLIGTLVATVYLTWLNARLWLNLAAPAALIFFLYTSMTLQSFITSEMERRRTRAMFGRYVSPAVMEELLKNPALASLGGQRREVTILFADIRGFTSYSENKPPEEVVARLNTYLNQMTTLIFKHGGTLDKYLGDGLMAVFGAPLPLKNHAGRTVVCSLEIQREVAKLNKEYSEKGQQPLRIGIGVNTGDVLVGNVGSHERMDYTVIGEDVNLASRLESLTKEFGVNIVMSGRTRAKLDTGELDTSGIVDLGETRIRGFDKPVHIFGLAVEEALITGKVKTQKTE